MDPFLLQVIVNIMFFHFIKKFFKLMMSLFYNYYQVPHYLKINLFYIIAYFLFENY